MIALGKESSCSPQLCLALCAFGLLLLGDLSRAVPMDDQDYYLQEISNRDHYYSFPYPGEEYFPFTEQPGEEGTIRAAQPEEHPGFKPSKKQLKPKKSSKKGKSILETPPGNFPRPPPELGVCWISCWLWLLTLMNIQLMGVLVVITVTVFVVMMMTTH